MGLFSRSKTIYYPGSTLTKYHPELVNNWKSLLSDYGITFEIDESIHSGWPLWDQGYHKQFEKHISWLNKYFEEQNISNIITNSPEAIYIFRTFFPNITSKHTTEIVFENISRVQHFNSGIICFHDNTTQVRRNNIINQPRRILVRAGFTIIEFEENKTKTQCIGTSTGLVNNSPRLAEKLIMKRVRKAPAELIITDSPEDYVFLKRQNDQVKELSEVLVEI